MARVVPIFKKGNKLFLTNYRTVSLISCSCKLLEYCMTNYITHFLDERGIFSTYQHHFGKGFATTTQFATAVRFFSSVLDRSGRIHTIFLDFSEAFDRDSHSKVISKVDYNGLPLFIVHWVAPYLNNKKQMVVIDGTLSEPSNVRSGVLQRSVVGPLLFFLFMLMKVYPQFTAALTFAYLPMTAYYL